MLVLNQNTSMFFCYYYYTFVFSPFSNCSDYEKSEMLKIYRIVSLHLLIAWYSVQWFKKTKQQYNQWLIFAKSHVLSFSTITLRHHPKRPKLKLWPFASYLDSESYSFCTITVFVAVLLTYSHLDYLWYCRFTLASCISWSTAHSTMCFTVS